MNVYILYYHNRYEDAYFEGIYSSEEAAMKRVISIQDSTKNYYHNGEWSLVYPNAWENSDDRLYIQNYVVLD